MSGLFFLGIIFMVIGLIVSGILKSKFAKFSNVPIDSGLTGKEVAEKMLADHGIRDVKVIEHEGFLSDHYNPATKTVHLSPAVYQNNSVASAAVAAHECGHAVQHATFYSMLQLRSKMVPAVQFSSMLVQWVIIAGLFFFAYFDQFLLIAIVLYGIITLFSLITLPVEFDASKRATAWLYNTRIVGDGQHKMAVTALNWAAMTYVVAAIASLTSLIYLILMYLGRR